MVGLEVHHDHHPHEYRDRDHPDFISHPLFPFIPDDGLPSRVYPKVRGNSSGNSWWLSLRTTTYLSCSSTLALWDR